jgi:hypothetical protein
MSWQQPQDAQQPQEPQWATPPQGAQGVQQGAPQQYPVGQQPGQVPPPFYTPHPYEKKRSGFGTRQIIAIVVIVLVVGGYFAYNHLNGKVDATSLTVGECFNGTSLGDQNISTVNSISCTSGHSAQVLGIVPMTDSSYPDDATLDGEAQSDCKSFYDALPSTGIPDDAQGAYIAPDSTAFSNGVKSIDCLIQSPTEDLTQSYSK